MKKCVNFFDVNEDRLNIVFILKRAIDLSNNALTNIIGYLSYVLYNACIYCKGLNVCICVIDDFSIPS